jgi:Xaa-Pro dipeptidase
MTRRDRALAVARDFGADAVLAAHVGTVAWLTGYAASIGTGPSPWALMPFAMLTPDGPPVLVVTEDEAAAAAATDCEVVTYPGYGIGPLDPVGGTIRALSAVVDGRLVATEPASIPAPVAARLELVDASRELGLARAVKDPDEIDKIRASVRVADAGQRAVRERAAAGMTELDAWAYVCGAMHAAAGSPIPSVADLVSGPSSQRWEGPPGRRELEDGDLIITDLSPLLSGYWADSCSTIAIGEPTSAARSAHARIRGRLERAVDAVRPGVIAGDLDALIREGLAYPHHSGHGIGTTYHEEPRIVPGWPTVLEPGMVLALEPGHYTEDLGVRLEWVVLVTDDGYEVLSRHLVDL